MDTAFYRFTVGAFTCTAVSDGTFPYPPHAFVENGGPTEPESALSAHGRPADAIVTPYTCLVVETGRHRILVDTGLGQLPEGYPQSTGRLQSNLRAAGIDSTTIDFVVITHCHADHIGGNLNQDGALAFPNARFAMARTEWEFWAGEPSLIELRADETIKELLRQWARTNLPPLQGRIDLIDGEAELVPGVTMLPAPGHTPGHVALAIESEGEMLLHLVDTALDPLHLEHPGWIAEFDFDPTQVVATRRRLFDRAADEGTRVLAYHFPFPGLGWVSRSGEGWRWEPEEERREGTLA
jgi:glyoxylase-like metal-dependent hydrolase (beta-lactamase superfamily II)